MPFGQAIDVIILDDIHQPDVAAHRMKKVIPADAVGIAIAVHADHLHVVIGQLVARGQGQSAPMQPVQAIDVHIIGRLAATADAGDHHHLLRAEASLDESALEGIPDAVIATAWTPSGADVIGEILNGRHYLPSSLLRM